MVCDVWRNRWRWNLFRETGSCWLRYFNPSKLRVLIGPIADAGRDRDRGLVESASGSPRFSSNVSFPRWYQTTSSSFTQQFRRRHAISCFRSSKGDLHSEEYEYNSLHLYLLFLLFPATSCFSTLMILSPNQLSNGFFTNVPSTSNHSLNPFLVVTFATFVMSDFL